MSAPQISRETAKGQLLTYTFHQDDVAASQSAVALKLVEGNDGTTNVSLATDEYPVPFGFDIIGIAVESSAARTGGTLTVDATINGTVTGLQAALDATNTTSDTGTQKRGSDTGVAGDRIGCKITTDASWAPTTADISVTVYAIVSLDGI